MPIVQSYEFDSHFFMLPNTILATSWAVSHGGIRRGRIMVQINLVFKSFGRLAAYATSTKYVKILKAIPIKVKFSMVDKYM